MFAKATRLRLLGTVTLILTAVVFSSARQGLVKRAGTEPSMLVLTITASIVDALFTYGDGDGRAYPDGTLDASQRLVDSHAAHRSSPLAKHGPATIVLQDGYDLPATYETVLRANAVRPTAMATADFDVDGYPDLVSGYATGDGGYLSFQRGNPEAFAPTQPENVDAIREGRFSPRAARRST